MKSHGTDKVDFEVISQISDIKEEVKTYGDDHLNSKSSTIPIIIEKVL